MHNKMLSKILDACLRRIWAGESTIEDCLRRYPEHAEQLAPMLAVAVEVRTYLAPQTPKPGYLKASWQRILNRMSIQQRSPARPVAAKPVRRLRPAQAFLSMILVLSVLAVGVGAVHASAAALPGDALYGLKLGLERARLALSTNAAGDLDILTRRADTRLDELQNMIGEGKGEGVGVVLEGYDGVLTDLTDLATTTDPETIPGSLAHVLARLQHHQDVLVRVLEQAPPSAQPAIEHAMQRSSHSQEVIQQVRQGGSPSELAPGQQRTPTPTPSEVPTMHVIDLDAHRTGKQVRVDVEVSLAGGGKVSGATVTGSWSVSGSGVVSSCVTTGSGKCHLWSGDIPEAMQATFTVTSISHASYSYAPGDNSDPDGDSDGTTVTIDLDGPESPTATPTPEPHTLHVSQLILQKVNGNAGNWHAFVTATIARDDDLPITNAKLYGTWTYAGGGPDSDSCLPEACEGHIKTGATEAMFTVTSISHASYSYAPWDNDVNFIIVDAPE